MKLKKTVAKMIANVSMAMAKKACGNASVYGAYEPKEPKELNNLKK